MESSVSLENGLLAKSDQTSEKDVNKFCTHPSSPKISDGTIILSTMQELWLLCSLKIAVLSKVQPLKVPPQECKLCLQCLFQLVLHFSTLGNLLCSRSPSFLLCSLGLSCRWSMTPWWESISEKRNQKPKLTFLQVTALWTTELSRALEATKSWLMSSKRHLMRLEKALLACKWKQGSGLVTARDLWTLYSEDFNLFNHGLLCKILPYLTRIIKLYQEPTLQIFHKHSLLSCSV